MDTSELPGRPAALEEQKKTNGHQQKTRLEASKPPTVFTTALIVHTGPHPFSMKCRFSICVISITTVVQVSREKKSNSDLKDKRFIPTLQFPCERTIERPLEVQTYYGIKIFTHFLLAIVDIAHPQ